jgi:hypothetical protein
MKFFDRLRRQWIGGAAAEGVPLAEREPAIRNAEPAIEPPMPATAPGEPDAAPVVIRSPSHRPVRHDDDVDAIVIGETCGGCLWWLARSGTMEAGYCRLDPPRVRTIARDYCSHFVAR